MGLPKLTVPTFELTIPSTKKKVIYRPFLSNEEKILMLVKQSEDSEMVLRAMKDIIEVCTFKKIDADTLAIFDIEYIFLQLRSKSVGEIIEIDMKCINEIELPKSHDHPAGVDNEKTDCGSVIPFEIDISKIEVNFPEDHSDTIMLENNIGITLRYPSIADVEMIEDNSEDDIEIIRQLIINIFDENEVYDIADTSKEDFDEFMETINTKQIGEIRKKFFYSMPIVEYIAKYTCPSCGYKGEYTFRGINDFF